MSEQVLEAAPEEAAVSPDLLELDSFEQALERDFKPKSDQAREEIKLAVEVLAEQALKGQVVPESAVATIKGLIAALDQKISMQMDEILHHEKFQNIESSWRGLFHLVSNTETSTEQKIRVMAASKKELLATIKKFPGTAWDQSPLFKKIYGEEYDMLGGDPFGCLVGDYYFDHSPQDVKLLEGIGRIAAASHAPFIAAADPSLIGLDSWQEIMNPVDLKKKMSTPDYATWNGFRGSEDSRYVSLTLPRFLSRLPYGADTNPIDEFAYEEQVQGNHPKDFCWSNAAYAMAANINAAYSLYGWCTRIRGVESGGTVAGLPVYTFPSDEGGLEMTCPTEVAIGERREMELSNLGLLGFIHRKGTEEAVFMGAQTLNEPKIYDDDYATDNAKLSARLPYIFACCRFAHFLKVMVRDKVGSTMEEEELRKYLTNWVMQYVCPDPQNQSEAVKAKRPLADAQVIVEPIAGSPGFYKATFKIRPHYQLEGMTVSMSLVSKIKG